MSIGHKIIDEIGKQAMVTIGYPDPEATHVFVWASNSAEQLEALIADHHMTELERAERDILEVIAERDHREDVIDELCAAVGHRNGFEFEWSSAYGYHDAIDDVENIIDNLRAEVKRLTDKAAALDSELSSRNPKCL